MYCVLGTFGSVFVSFPWWSWIWCSHQIYFAVIKSLWMVTATMRLKNHLLLGRKAITNLNSIWKSKDITLPTKVCPVKAMVFPLVMYGCESWTIKSWCFWIVVWRRLLRIPWTAWWSSQSILKEINPEHSLEGLMMKLKLQYFGHLMQRTDSLERLRAGGEGDNRGLYGWMASLAQWTWVWVSYGR